jgi:tripartite-type tricarboxylate transporter receptor subunit TctC
MRALADSLSRQTKGAFILEYKPGAGAMVGTQALLDAPADGHALLFSTSALAISPVLYPDRAVDPRKALAAVSLITEVPITIIARTNSEYKTLQEFVAAARKNPGKYNYGSGGIGTANHLAGELFNKLAGTQIEHIPYKGAGPAANALLGGEIDIVFLSMTEAMTRVQAGGVRAIGVAAAEAVLELPDVPLVRNIVPDYVVGNWFGLFARSDTPAAVLETISRELAKVKDSNEIREVTAKTGLRMLLTDPTPLKERVERDVPRYKAIVEAAGIKAE